MKKFISVMLVAAMAVTALTGCGSNSGSSSKKDADKYYIGGIGPTTGATAIYGTAVKNGAQIAVDEINAAGGINGKQIEYRFEDDQNDAEKSVNAYNTLKDWGMQMLVGTTTTAPCIAVAGKTASDNMFQITPSASAHMYSPVETVIYSRYVLQTLTRVLHLLSILQRTSLLRRLVLSMIVLMYILQVSKRSLKQKLRIKDCRLFLKQHLQQILRQTLEHSFRKQKMQVPIYSSYLFTIRKLLLS